MKFHNPAHRATEEPEHVPPKGPLHLMVACGTPGRAASLQAQVIEELVPLAREMREGNPKGEPLGLSKMGWPLCDAVDTNGSTVKALGEPTLQQVARELVERGRRYSAPLEE